MYRVLSLLALMWFAESAFAAGVPAPTWPLWDGHESTEQYAKRADLPPTKSFDLGNGVNLELVLIPAGKFIMGTPEPRIVDEVPFKQKVMVGQAVLAAGGGILLVLIGLAILRAIRERRRFQYSLRRFMAMMFAASLCVLGGMHWWFSTKALAQAKAEYEASVARYRNSDDWEKPAHQVTLTKPILMAKFLTTEEQYQQFMGSNPSTFIGPNLPVENVSWVEAQEFCKKVSERTGQTVRLPTEAEWEYACRAGTITTYNTGDKESDLGLAGWYNANSKNTTHPVGQKRPNAWGLYDMHGNVWEWCQDWWGEKYYEGGPKTDPQGPETGSGRVLRGGSWFYHPLDCRAASRGWDQRGGPRALYSGIRVVMVARTP